jgi:hypothetical protein
MILQDLRYLEEQKHRDESYDVETGEIQVRLPVNPTQKYDRAHHRAGTFGAASECKVRQISKELRQEALESLGEERAKEEKRMKLPLSLKRKALRNAHINWLNEKCNGWQLAVSLHFPSSLAHMKGDFSTDRIEKQINLFFNRMEKRLFGRRGRKKVKKKLSRVVVVENDDSVGLHVHMVMLLPVGMKICEFIEMLKQQWKRFWAGQVMTFSNEHAVWAEAISGDYVKYSLKNVGTAQAEVLWNSSHL